MPIDIKDIPSFEELDKIVKNVLGGTGFAEFQAASVRGQLLLYEHLIECDECMKRYKDIIKHGFDTSIHKFKEDGIIK